MEKYKNGSFVILCNTWTKKYLNILIPATNT